MRGKAHTWHMVSASSSLCPAGGDLQLLGPDASQVGGVQNHAGQIVWGASKVCMGLLWEETWNHALARGNMCKKKGRVPC